MDYSQIHCEADYFRALKEIEALMSAKSGTPEGERLDDLITIVEAYERQHHLIGATAARPT